MAEILGPQRLGPLTPLVGEWEGNVGVDLSYHNEDDLTGETGYFEKAWFRPIPKQENGKQSLEGLTYQMTAWRHGEEAMNPFHDEVGYLLWEKATGEIMRAVVFGRGIAALAGGTRMHATRSSPCAPRRGHRPMGWCRTNTCCSAPRSRTLSPPSRCTATAPSATNPTCCFSSPRRTARCTTRIATRCTGSSEPAAPHAAMRRRTMR